MVQLNFPPFQFKIQNNGTKPRIFDEIRRKYVALTPEEWVRQHMIQFLLRHKNYPAALMAVESQVIAYGLKQRADLVIYNRTGTPVMIIECKAPHINLTNDVFDQAARYNINLKVNYLVVTNGLTHFCALLNHQQNSYQFLKEIPDFTVINS